MRILIFTNQYGKCNNYVTGFPDNTNVLYHGLHPTNAVEATQDNIEEFLKRHDEYDLNSVEYSEGLVRWDTVESIYKGHLS